MTGLLWQPKESNPPPPSSRTWIKYTIPVHTPTQTHHHQRGLFPVTRLINVRMFVFVFLKIKNKWWRPNRNLRLLFQYWTTLKYTAQLLPIHYIQIRYSFQLSAPLPDVPIVLEKWAWLPLSLALPFSSWLFDSEEESGWRSSRRAVEGESAISTSLPVLNSLMKFRSEEGWHETQPYNTGRYIHLSVSLWWSIYAFLCLFSCLNSGFDFGPP